MIVLGITGSIGMGKSMTANMLGFLGVSVHDADEEVHKLLFVPGKASDAVRAQFPYFSYPKIYGKKSRNGYRPLLRAELGKVVFADDQARQKLEDILHPFVREAQMNFIKKQKSLGRKIAALDIPLLFETGADKYVDYTINVSAPYFIQKARVLSRPGMDFDKFQAILNRQMPDGEKSVRADFIVHTGLGRAYAMKQIKKILFTLRYTPEDEEEDEAA